MTAVSFFNGGSRGRGFGNLQLGVEPPVYVKPPYLLNATRRKYGRNVYVIGTEETKLNEFWANVEVKATGLIQRPQEIGRSVVDVTAKEHINTGNDSDSLQILTQQTETRTERKKYSLSFAKGWEFSGSINVTGSFFNIVGAGAASVGLGGTAKRTTQKTEESSKEEERSLSQQYGVTGTIAVPANHRVQVMITTWAVNYKATVRAAFSVPITAVIPVYYKSGIPKLLCAGDGAICRSFGYITAEDLFQNEEGHNIEGGSVCFTKETDLSYLGETIEMYKIEVPLSTK